MKKDEFDTVIVIGAGAFGTSIASLLSNRFKTVILKVRSDDVYESIKTLRMNKVYLDGMLLAPNVHPALSWDEVDSFISGEVQLLVGGLPTSSIRSFCSTNKDYLNSYLKNGVPFVSLSKGIDADTLELPDDLYFDFFPEFKDQFTFLSGPSFAKEIMNEQITAVTLAGRHKKNLAKVVNMLQADYFLVFANYDIKGVLLGGALKNILAIAGGIIEGLGFNHNTRAAMITRGIAEMLRFGRVYNARPETFYGMSGMGDLILTTTGDLSRNKVFGLKIAQGQKPKDIIESQRFIVEGYKTAKAAHLIAKNYDIRARIFEAVYKVLYEDMGPEKALRLVIRTSHLFEDE